MQRALLLKGPSWLKHENHILHRHMYDMHMLLRSMGINWVKLLRSMKASYRGRSKAGFEGANQPMKAEEDFHDLDHMPQQILYYQ